MEANVDHQLEQLISQEYKLFFTMLDLDRLFERSFFNSFDGNLQSFCSRVLNSYIITDDRQDYQSVSLRVIEMIEFDDLKFVNENLFSAGLLGTDYDLFFHTEDKGILNELYIALNVTNDLRSLTNSFVFVFSGVKSSRFIDNIPFVFDTEDYNYCIYEDLTSFVPLNELISNKELSIREYTNILLQVVYALVVAERRNKFKHNNLIATNVLIRVSKIPFQIKIDDTFMITTILPKIIDFTRSSVTVDGINNNEEVNSTDVIKTDIEVFLESSRSYGMNTFKFVNDKMNNPEEYMAWLLEQFPLYFRINQEQNDEIKGLYCEFNQQCYPDETLRELILEDFNTAEFDSLDSLFDVVMKEKKIGVNNNLYSEVQLEESLEKLVQATHEEINELFELKEISTVEIIQWNRLKKYITIIETITENPVESKKLNEIQLRMIEEIKNIKSKYNIE